MYFKLNCKLYTTTPGPLGRLSGNNFGTADKDLKLSEYLGDYVENFGSEVDVDDLWDEHDEDGNNLLD